MRPYGGFEDELLAGLSEDFFGWDFDLDDEPAEPDEPAEADEPAEPDEPGEADADAEGVPCACE